MQHTPIHPKDAHLALQIAASLADPDPCPRCHGEGIIEVRVSIDNSLETTCPACGGDGYSHEAAREPAEVSTFDAAGFSQELPF